MSTPSSSTPSSSAASSPSKTPQQPHNVDDATLVYHILLLLIALTAVFIVVRIPRAIARGEWGRGWVLWYSEVRKGRHGRRSSRQTQRERPAHARGHRRNAYPPANVPVDVDVDGNTECNTHYNGLAETEKGRRGYPYPEMMNFPTHVPSCPAFLRPLLVPLRARLLASPPGSSVPSSAIRISQSLILAIYFYAWIYAAFYRSNIFTDPERTGWIAVAQLPLVMVLGAKNGALGWLGGGGWGYEKINFLHRFAGRGVVVGANFHSVHYFYQWALAGTFKKNMGSPSNVWGMVALISVNMIFLFSIQSIRNRAYNLFLATHILGFILLLPAIYMHKPILLPYILASTAIYTLDLLIRLVKTRITTARLVPLPELEMTRVEIPSINAGWRAGQHVRLRVCAGGGFGWFGWMEVHPFTIASVSISESSDSVDGEGTGMVLMCKRAGGWTRKLYEVAKLGGYSSNVEGGKGGREVRVIVEGPYGGPGHVNFASFSAAVYVVGGSGITYALAAIRDLVGKDVRGESRVKVVELVWIVADPACLAPLLPTFTELIRQSVFTPLRISVFYTRAPIGKQPAYFDSVDASPFAAPSPSPSPNNSNSSANPRGATPAIGINTDVNVNANANGKPNHPKSHTLISPVADDTQAFALAYQQRLEQQRSARARPPPSKRPSSPYEAPRTAPTPPSAYTQPKSGAGAAGGPQRQDSNASARTLVNDGNSNTRNNSLKRSPTSGSRHLPPGLTLAPGRPKIAKFLEHALQRAVVHTHDNPKDDDARGGGGRLSGMVVGVCGPSSLAEDVVRAVGALDAVRRDQVGGVEVCEEVFGW